VRCDAALLSDRDPRYCVLELAPLIRRANTADGKLRPTKEPLLYDRAAKPPVPGPTGRRLPLQ